jgi:hypothetical protein
MRSSRVRFTGRRLMIATVAVACLALGMVWAINRRFPPANFPAPARIFYAAIKAVPDIMVTSVRSETVNHQRAWEVRGTAHDGTVWLIDIFDTGELIGREPVTILPPPSVAEPVPEF